MCKHVVYNCTCIIVFYEILYWNNYRIYPHFLNTSGTVRKAFSFEWQMLKIEIIINYRCVVNYKITLLVLNENLGVGLQSWHLTAELNRGMVVSKSDFCFSQKNEFKSFSTHKFATWNPLFVSLLLFIVKCGQSS